MVRVGKFFTIVDDGHLVVTRMRKKSVLLNVNWNNLEGKKDAVFALPDSEVGNLFRGYVHNLRPTTNIFFWELLFFFSFLSPIVILQNVRCRAFIFYRVSPMVHFFLENEFVESENTCIVEICFHSVNFCLCSVHKVCLRLLLS